jgi:4a-hydroxytetrahydrobiopterin dehydratase
MSALGDGEIVERLRATPGWARSGNTIARVYRFGDFKEAMLFVNGVAALAERAEHHPDLTVRYREVTLSLWTHSEGGVTAKDFDLARKIDTTFGR